MKLQNEIGTLETNGKLIRCKNIINGKICNNLLCVVNKDEIRIKRHGRQIDIPLIGYSIDIVCERCRKITKIGGNKT